jgi:very-short-patch-repair endonuclease
MNKKLTKDEFVNRAVLKHGSKYDYSKTEYIDSYTKVCILCPEHGEFWQTPHSHMSGCGCPGCSESHLEKDVETYLDENKIKYEKYKHFKWLGKQHLDFYLTDYNVGIECQGVQHFKPVDYFGGDKKFTYQIKNDIKKKYLCEENNIKIIYFTDVKDESTNDMIHNINEIKEKIIEYGSNKNQCG